MYSTDRARKLIALSRFMEGNDSLIRSLKPRMTLDLDKLSSDEMEELRRLQTTLPESEQAQWDLARLEAHFGRKLELIPQPQPVTF